MSAVTDYLDALVTAETVLRVRTLDGNDYGGVLTDYIANSVTEDVLGIAVTVSVDEEPVFIPFHALASLQAQ